MDQSPEAPHADATTLLRIDAGTRRELERLAAASGGRLAELVGHLLCEAGDDLPATRRHERFIAGLTHQARTPLGSVLMLAELLAEDGSDPLNERQARYARNIHQAAGDILRLLDDVRALSRLEAGRGEVLRGRVPLHELLEELATELRPAAAAAGVTLVLVIDDGTPRLLTSDRGHIADILRRLAVTAFGAAPGGRVTLRATANADGGVDLAVSDDGEPIPDADREALFAPFHGAKSIRRGVSGLELTICRELAHLLGTRLAVDAGDGVNTFTLTLPLDAG